MRRRKPLIRIVPFKEIMECPALRLDAEHYIPRHRRWECMYGTRLRSRGALIKAWLDGEVSSEDLLEAIRLELEEGGGCG